VEMFIIAKYWVLSADWVALGMSWMKSLLVGCLILVIEILQECALMLFKEILQRPSRNQKLLPNLIMEY